MYHGRSAASPAPVIARAIQIFTLIALLGAPSARAEPINAEYSFKEDQSEGVVFLSVSHDLAGRRAVRAMFYLDGGPLRGGSILYSLRDAFPGIQAGSEFKDSYGQLIALALPVGKHRIESWQIFNGAGLRIHPREKPAPLEFDVVAGQARYLGNLHANLQAGRNIFGIMIVVNGYPEVRDRRDRDVESFAKKFPQLSEKVVAEPLTPGPWESGASRTQLDPPMPVTPLPAR
jgi:hypothetical protein